MALSSCSKSDEMPTQPQMESTTFTLVVEGVQTRATSEATPVRYVMEVWSEDGLTAENVFGTGETKTNRTEVTTGNAFTVILDKTKAYTCLFWADDNTTFNATSLKTISLNSGKDMAEAYFSKVAVANGKPPAVTVRLKRAVAKITLTETAAVKTTDNIALKLSNIYPTFSVLNGEASGTAAEWTKTIKPSATTNTVATLYFFAKADKEPSDLKFTYATEAEKTVSNIPVQQNFSTNIKGEYSAYGSFTFTLTADDEGEIPDNEVEFPRAMVGDFYYSDKTFSNAYENTKTCIGIIYAVNANGKSGKIVGLTEPEANWNSGANIVGKLTWGPKGKRTNATDELDGSVNMTAIKKISGWETAYPAFAWAESRNTPAIAGINWYLPAMKELRQLYAAMSGLKWVALGATIGEIGDWGNSVAMPDYATYSTARTTFNSLFTTAGGTAMTSYYWSSTQGQTLNAHRIFFTNGDTYLNGKDVYNSVRVVSAF